MSYTERSLFGTNANQPAVNRYSQLPKKVLQRIDGQPTNRKRARRWARVGRGRKPRDQARPQVPCKPPGPAKPRAASPLLIHAIQETRMIEIGAGSVWIWLWGVGGEFGGSPCPRGAMGRGS